MRRRIPSAASWNVPPSGCLPVSATQCSTAWKTALPRRCGIPAVKGVEFGAGFGASRLRGSENNDAFRVEDGRIVTETNRAGGILGGITTGMPLTLRVGIKPTPSIGRPQKTVSLARMENTELTIRGRHDPCIAHRAVPVVEAVTACVLLDLLLEEHHGTF